MQASMCWFLSEKCAKTHLHAPVTWKFFRGHSPRAPSDRGYTRPNLCRFLDDEAASFLFCLIVSLLSLCSSFDVINKRHYLESAKSQYNPCKKRYLHRGFAPLTPPGALPLDPAGGLQRPPDPCLFFLRPCHPPPPEIPGSAPEHLSSKRFIQLSFWLVSIKWLTTHNEHLANNHVRTNERNS
jgi:hypothetical protein